MLDLNYFLISKMRELNFALRLAERLLILFEAKKEEYYRFLLNLMKKINMKALMFLVKIIYQEKK